MSYRALILLPCGPPLQQRQRRLHLACSPGIQPSAFQLAEGVRAPTCSSRSQTPGQAYCSWHCYSRCDWCRRHKLCALHAKREAGTIQGRECTSHRANADTQGTQNHNTPTAGKTPTAQPSPTQSNPAANTKTDTAATYAHAKPPSHTGTVIGYTSQATNSAKRFSNPADGQGSLLIRLPNGNFVACERACTHAGVAVNYDSGSHQLLCPAHGAIFDP